jgi:VWFA-related protein
MISDSCSGAVIPPSSNCGLTIRFSPTAQTDYLGNLNIPSNDSDAGLVTATLLGKGRAFNMSINRVTLEGSTVRVLVSVSDRFDAPVTTLTQSNFSIFENGSPKSIDIVSNTTKPPVSVGMVLDYSASTIPYTSDLETAAKSFIDLLDPVNDEAEVYKFAALIEVTQPFTQDKVALKAAIDAPFPYVRFGTVLYDTIWTSLNSTSLRSNPQHAIIAVTDGWDEAESIRTMSDVIAGAVDNNIQIFTIGIGDADNVSLQKLATDTGGQYFYVPTLSELINVYSTISVILSNEYTIEYTTSSAAGSTISLDVMVEDEQGQLGEYSRIVGF